MPVTLTSPNTFTSLSTMSPDSVRKLWQTAVNVSEANEDYWQKFEGGPNAVVTVKTDLSAGRGASLTITTRAGYHGDGKVGDETFESDEDFEQDVVGDFSVTVDFLRNATAITERTEEIMGMRNELLNGSATLLGEWMGRQKARRMFLLFRERNSPSTLRFANNRASQDDLVSSDILDWDEIVAAGYHLQPQGGQPARMSTINGNVCHKYIVHATSLALESLERDSTWLQIHREAQSRSDDNPLFTGGWVDVRGHRISSYVPIDHDGHAVVGTPWAPKAFLGAAITAGTGTFDIIGGGSAQAAANPRVSYFQDFPGYAFKFHARDVLTPPSETRYVLIVNPRDGSPNAGKIGMYSYTTGNNGKKITIVNRLGPSAGGARVTTLGSVVWNTGVWANRHTDAHPIGSVVIPCNSKGVPIGDTVMTGRMAALRGYGKYRNRRTEETDDGGMRHKRFITSVFGQTLRKDTAGVTLGVVRIRHALAYTGLGLPAVT